MFTLEYILSGARSFFQVLGEDSLHSRLPEAWVSHHRSRFFHGGLRRQKEEGGQEVDMRVEEEGVGIVT